MYTCITAFYHSIFLSCAFHYTAGSAPGLADILGLRDSEDGGVDLVNHNMRHNLRARDGLEMYPSVYEM